MPETKDSLEVCFAEGAKFHGVLSPGLAIGIYMVDLAKEVLGAEDLVDAVVETKRCVPDAIQLMTPCTYGNGWMKVKDWGKFAVTLYNKKELEGVRVYLDPDKVKNYPLIHKWFMNQGQTKWEDVVVEIKKTGRDLLSWKRVKVTVPPKGKGPVLICPSCGEAYRTEEGEACVRCSGKDDYYQIVASS